MLTTPLRLYPIPSKYLPQVGRIVRELSYITCAEGLAWLNGEKACLNEVNNFLNRVDEFRDDDVKVPPMPEDDGIVLLTTDGTLQYSKASLMRRFHFFDDFYSAFPEGDPKLPYSTNQVYEAIHLEGSMEDCLNCMRYLNPKNNLEYFYLTTQNVPRETLMSLVGQLTDEERSAVMAAKKRFEATRPYEGTLMAPLAVILEYYGDGDAMKACFPDHPSYIYAQTLDCDLLLTEDFSREWSPSVGVVDSLAHHLFSILANSSDVKYIRRCLTMLGMTCTLFKNEEEYIPLPYGIDAYSVLDQTLPHRSTAVWINVARVLELDSGEMGGIMSNYPLFRD